MALIQEVVYAALVAAGTAAGNRIYPQGAPNDYTIPFIVYHRISAEPQNMMDGSTPTLRNTLLQLDSYDNTYAGAQALSLQVAAALTPAPIRALVAREEEFYEADVKLHRIVLELSIWSAS